MTETDVDDRIQDKFKSEWSLLVCSLWRNKNNDKTNKTTKQVTKREEDKKMKNYFKMRL